MKALGIVGEYNPFHQGHKYLIDTASALHKADVCISVMSGNFVQRGNFAYYDKWQRAEAAVEKGVDLVVELPQVYACSSSRLFAEGAIKLLNHLGCNILAFGSETGNEEAIKSYGDMIYQCETKYAGDLRAAMKKGLSYPSAMSEVLKKRFNYEDTDLLQGPNDILAIEYIMSINRNGFNIIPSAIKRMGVGHLKTGTHIRNELLNSSQEGPRLKEMEERFFGLLKYRLVSMSALEIESFDTASEGLGNKIKDEIRYSKTLDELITNVKSKRYTYTRISRLLTHILLGIKPELTMMAPAYIRPLAMNDKGANYLKNIKKKNDRIEYVDDVSKAMKYGSQDVKNMLSIDIGASDVYSILREGDMYQESDYVRKPAVLHL